MNEPWFNPMWAWIPGTLLGVLGGGFGALAGMLAPRGKGKIPVLAVYWALVLGSVVLLVAGVVALIVGQPYGIWYGLGLAGLIGVVVLGCNGPVLYIRYRQAEQRRLEAHDL